MQLLSLSLSLSRRSHPSRTLPFEVRNQQVHDVDGFGFAFVSENTGTVYRHRNRNRDYYNTSLKRAYRHFLANEGDDDSWISEPIAETRLPDSVEEIPLNIDLRSRLLIRSSS